MRDEKVDARPTVVLADLLPPSAVSVGRRASDWRSAVRLAGAGLVAAGATSPAYIDEMIRAVEEFGPYIVIAPGIALAHSRPSDSVHRVGMSIAILQEPVSFGHAENDPVRLVVGLAAPDSSSHIEALATLAEMLADDATRRELLNAHTPGDVLSTIRRWRPRPDS